MKNLSFSIIGYGRFGKILHKLLSQHSDKIFIFDSRDDASSNVQSLEKALQSDIVFIAVPIRKFESVIVDISQYRLHNTTIIDVCSVKVYPSNIMKQYLPEHVGIVSSHPLFGPDSFSQFRELKMMMHPLRDVNNHYKILKNLFESSAVRIVEITPEEHDKMAASSQGITHFIGRVLHESGIKSTQINTLGFNDLLGVIEQTCNDSWDLFKDLQNYNPYTKDMIGSIETAIDLVKDKIKLDDECQL
jgi:prephenate dehydrogenase